MGIIDNELLDQLCECVQRDWPGRGIIPGQVKLIIVRIWLVLYSRRELNALLVPTSG